MSFILKQDPDFKEYERVYGKMGAVDEFGHFYVHLNAGKCVFVLR